MRKDEIEAAVLSQVLQDLQSPEFIARLTAETRCRADTQTEDPTAGLRTELEQVNRSIDKCTDLALKLDDPTPAIERLERLQTERRALAARVAAIEQESIDRRVMSNITEAQVHKTLATLAEELGECEQDRDREVLKDLLQAVVAKVALDPIMLECRVHYRIAADGWVNEASPRGLDEIPTIRLKRPVKIIRRRFGSAA